jgi:D-arabinose 1-dehydrogenase-like Zn-dependent alcohol dehydrogenase
MRAAVLKAFNQPLELTQVAEPNPGADEVVIRVRAVGLCGTDLKVITGAIDTVNVPLIPGHEVSGEIVLGTGSLQRGQRVACYLYSPCGACRWCAAGQDTLCPHSRRIGYERDGGLAEFIAVPAINALPFGEDLPFEAAAVAMDAVLSPWHALVVRAQLSAGESLVVVGAGGLGLNAVQIGRNRGVAVAAIDPLQSHREVAEQLGAELAVAPEDWSSVVDWSKGGVDVAFEASGTKIGVNAAISSLRPGGRVVCCGYRPGLDVSLGSVELVLGELTILGSRAGSRSDALASLRAVEEGAIKPQISDRVLLSAVNTGLERLRDGSVLGRLVVMMS